MSDRLEEARKRIEKQRQEREQYDPVMEFMKLQDDIPEEKRYPHRDEIPEALLEYSDWYVKKTGQQPDKKVLSDWIDTFWYWNSKAIDEAALNEAYSKYELVYRPGTLTSAAVALQAQRRSKVHKSEIFRASEQEEKKFVPMPDSVRARLDAKLKQDRIGTSAHEPRLMSDVMKGMSNG